MQYVEIKMWEVPCHAPSESRSGNFIINAVFPAMKKRQELRFCNRRSEPFFRAQGAAQLTGGLASPGGLSRVGDQTLLEWMVGLLHPVVRRANYCVWGHD